MLIILTRRLIVAIAMEKVCKRLKFNKQTKIYLKRMHSYIKKLKFLDETPTKISASSSWNGRPCLQLQPQGRNIFTLLYRP